MSELKPYALRIDGPLLRNQRKLLLRIADAVRRGRPYHPLPGDKDLLEGLLSLTDGIADQAHDRHGIDCLLDGANAAAKGSEDERCECEKAGFFYSGVPGILAHMGNGRLAEGAEVNRCDLCQQYPSDEAAFEKLRELGYGPP